MTNLRVLLAGNIKERRRILGISQGQLADKVSTSSHYISQIEHQKKFPSPEMLERIAAALDIDTPQLFSMASYTEEALKRFQAAVLSDMETALAQSLTQTVNTHITELKTKPPQNPKE